MAGTPSDRPRIGFLYPGRLPGAAVDLAQAADDYPLAQSRLAPPVELVLATTIMEEDAHHEAALRRVGALEHLLEGAEVLREQGVRSAVWACTSGSFVFGLEGARAQASVVEDALGVPVSSTSLAFVDACRQLALERVAVAGSYPPEVVAMFVALLGEAGITVVASRSADIISGVGTGALDAARTLEFVAASDDAAAQAILVPDTAWNTVAMLDELDATLGKPVLTANQVSVWQGLRLAGLLARQDGLGALFANT